MSKYHSTKVELDGYTFDSRAEARRWQQLKLLAEAYEITALEVHPTFTLQRAYTNASGKRVRAITYEGDFQYEDADGRVIVEDVKGVETPVFRLKRRMLEKRFPWVELRVIPAKEV